MASTQSATDKKAALQKQLEALKKQMLEIDQEAVNELKEKLTDARKVVKDLESELSKLTGEDETAAAPKKARRQRRASISDEILKDQVLKMMAAFGQEGMNAKQIADKMHQDPIRIRKFIADNPKVLKRQGNAASTKFFLP